MSGQRRLRTFGWTASAAVVVALLAPAAAPAQTDGNAVFERATNGTVTAELSYVIRTRGRGRFQFDEYAKFRVKITRAGVVLYDQPVGDPCDRFCTPTETALTRKHVALRDLNADGEPEAIVGLFTGGANCCVLVLAYGYDAAANVYRRARLDTGGGYVARDYGGDGVIELVGDDFASEASSRAGPAVRGRSASGTTGCAASRWSPAISRRGSARTPAGCGGSTCASASATRPRS